MLGNPDAKLLQPGEDIHDIQVAKEAFAGKHTRAEHLDLDSRFGQYLGQGKRQMATRFIQDKNARAQRPGVFEGSPGCGADIKHVGEISAGNDLALGTIEALAGAFVSGAGCNYNARCLDMPQRLRCDLNTAPDLNPRIFDLPLQVVYRNRPGGQTRQLFQHAQMAAQLVGAFKQGDGVPTLGRHRGGFHPGRPATDDHNMLLVRLRDALQRTLSPVGFPAADRIQGADEFAVFKQPRPALITAVAADDFVFATFARLFHRKGVGQQLSGHRHHVCRAAFQYGLSRVEITHLAHDKDLAPVAHDFFGTFAERRQPAIRLVPFHTGQRQMERVIAPGRDVEKIKQASRRQHLDLFFCLFRGNSAPGTKKFVPRQPDSHHKIRPNPLAYLLGALDEQLAALGRCPAVGVIAFIIGRTHKLAQAVTMRPVQLDSIKPGALDVGRGLPKVVG